MTSPLLLFELEEQHGNAMSCSREFNMETCPEEEKC